MSATVSQIYKDDTQIVGLESNVTQTISINKKVQYEKNHVSTINDKDSINLSLELDKQQISPHLKEEPMPEIYPCLGDLNENQFLKVIKQIQQFVSKCNLISEFVIVE